MKNHNFPIHSDIVSSNAYKNIQQSLARTCFGFTCGIQKYGQCQYIDSPKREIICHFTDECRVRREEKNIFSIAAKTTQDA